MEVQNINYKEYVIYSSVNKMSRDMSIKVILCSDFYNSLRIEINRVIDNLIYRKISQNIVIIVTDLDTAQMFKEYFKGRCFINNLIVHVRFYPKGSVYFSNPQDFVTTVSEDSCGYLIAYDSRIALEYWATYFVNNDFRDTLFDCINTNYLFKSIYKKYLT